MQTTSKPEVFLAGMNSVEVEDCGTKVCPAIAAGYVPGDGDMSIGIAREYDKVLWEMADEGEIEVIKDIHGDGLTLIVDEEVAKKAWLQAIENIENDDRLDSAYAEPYDADVGREIAAEMGWLPEGEA